MERSGISLRFDDGRNEFIIELDIKGLRTFEASGSTVSEALTELAEQLDQEGL